MEAYTGFAEVYDIFMDEVPYAAWCDTVCGALERFGVSGGLVLDLGCGTGALTELLAARGYDMIGVDNAPEMLERAMRKRERSGHDILYLCQDMRSFELYGTVGAVVSLCDSLNYILDPEELLQVFCLVNNYLDPGGVFFFDFNTVYKYGEVIGDTVIAENREHCSFIWENEFDAASCVNIYDITIFTEEADGRYRKAAETHYQRGYTLAEIRALVERAGMIFLEAADADTKGAVTAHSERMYVAARDRGKNGEMR